MKPCKSVDYLTSSFQLGKFFLLLKIYLFWKIWLISLKRWKSMWISACIWWCLFKITFRRKAVCWDLLVIHTFPLKGNSLELPVLAVTQWSSVHNGPFLSSYGPLSENEVKCSAFDMEMTFHSHANKTHFHKKSWALGLLLKVRVFRNSEMAYWKGVYHRVDMGWRWSECDVLKTNFVLTNWLYILQIQIKLKQVKELILVMRTVSWEFFTFAFPQTTIMNHHHHHHHHLDCCHWCIVQINVASWQYWEQMMYYQFKISAAENWGEGGGSVSMKKIEEQQHWWIHWGGGGEVWGLLTP